MFSFFDIKKGYFEPKPNDSIFLMKLGTKEEKALLKLCVKTIADFLKTDIQRILSLPGYGMGTYSQLVAKQKGIKKYFDDIEPKTAPDTEYTIGDLYIRIDRIDLLDSINLVELSIKEQNALALLGIKTIKDFLELNARKVLELRYYGKNTYKKINNHQIQLLSYFRHIASTTIDEELRDNILRNLPILENSTNDTVIGSKPFSQESIERLPLYSSFLSSDFDVSKLHPSFYPNESILELDLNPRARNCLSNLGIDTIGKLLGMNEKDLKNQPNFGKRTVTTIRDSIKYFLSQKNGILPPPTIDYSSFENLISSWLHSILRDPRKIKIIIQYFGGLPAEGKTLEKCGKRFGISRERVRQLIKISLDKLRLPKNMSLINMFWSTVEKVLLAHKGLCFIKSMANEISKYFKWENAPIPVFLESIVIINTGFKGNDRSMIILDSCPCPNCEKLPKILKNIFSEVEKLHISNVISAMDGCCNRLCEKQPIPDGKFNNDFVEMIINNNMQLSSLLKINGDIIYSKELWNTEFGSLSDLSLAILKKHGKPMHFTELFSRIQRIRKSLGACRNTSSL